MNDDKTGQNARATELSEGEQKQFLSSNEDDFCAETEFTEKINIPAPFREIPIFRLELSVRLENVLRRLDVERLGDLNRISFAEIQLTRNCGRKTIDELRDLIAGVVNENFATQPGKARATDDFADDPEAKISVPDAVKTFSVEHFSFSTRLTNIFSELKVKTLADLENFSLAEIRRIENCGQRTFDELRAFLSTLRDASGRERLTGEYRQRLENTERENARQRLIERIETAAEIRVDTIIKNEHGKFFIPSLVKDVALKQFAVPARLEKLFDVLNIVTLGDLEKYTLDEMRAVKRYSRKTLADLQNFVVRVQSVADEDELREAVAENAPSALDLNGLLNSINGFLSELPQREREILLDRFGGGADERILTLEEIGEKFKVTRERIRQIESKRVKDLKGVLTGVSENALDKLNDDCAIAVCPLTARYLIHLTGKEYSLFEYAPNFYLRVLRELSPPLSIFEGSKIVVSQLGKEALTVYRQIKSLLDGEAESLPLAEVYNRLSARTANGEATLPHFFEAMRATAFVVDQGDAPEVLLISTDKNRLTMTEMARQVLTKSECALTPEAIIERARTMFGDDVDVPSKHSLANLPSYDPDFYLLDRRTIGLRRHFRLPEAKWDELKNDFYRLLSENKRPVSTTEVIAKKLFGWTQDTTAGEATEILREDARFKDLGRFLFTLAEWNVAEREPIKDLAVKILSEAGHPLAANEIGERVEQFRSVSATSMRTILLGLDSVREYNFGYFYYYGLKSWDDDFREFFVTKRKLIYHFVKRAETITFGDLCRKFGIAGDGASAEKLWRALRALEDLRFEPVYQSPETRITRGW